MVRHGDQLGAERLRSPLLGVSVSGNDIPCRVSADLRAYMSAQDEARLTGPEFNAWEDEHIEAVFCERMRKSAQELLIIAERLEMTQGSFGANPEKLGDGIAPLLIAFLKDARMAWEEA